MRVILHSWPLRQPHRRADVSGTNEPDAALHAGSGWRNITMSTRIVLLASLFIHPGREVEFRQFET